MAGNERLETGAGVSEGGRSDDRALDQGQPDDGGDDGDLVARAGAIVGRSRRVVVLTGAGISTDSGIPDFRGPQGVWTKDPAAERRATLEAYVSDPAVRRRSWRARVDSPTAAARPNPGHAALARFERTGRLDLLVTQNVDGLHLEAGSDPSGVIEIHGSMRDVVCLACGERRTMGEIVERVRAGDEDPACRATLGGGRPCGGLLKSATVSFGQSLVPDDVERAEAAARRCDLLLAVGTSLGVYPAAGLVPLAEQAGATVIIVNAEPTPFDVLAEVVLRGSITRVLPAILAPS